MSHLKRHVELHAERLFPSFFLAGFECSTPIDCAHNRIDELALTEHDRHVRSDYRRLTSCGIYAARDGVRWNLVDNRGSLDFSSAQPFVEAAESEGVTVIWDLFHYGYPADLDPFDSAFIPRFVNYCEAFARMLVKRRHNERGRAAHGVRFYTPVNEISFFAWAGAEIGWFAPHLTGRGAEMKRLLARAAIAGIDAIRSVDPAARIVNCDPVVRVVAPADAPWLHDEAEYFNAHYVCEAWDMLAGRIEPDLGGSPAHLDIVGVNYYGVNQWEHQRPGSVLADDDPRRAPFSELLAGVYERYHAPMIVAETSSYGDARAQWLDTLTAECMKAMAAGVELHGLCLYPIVGMADWHDGRYHPMGLWDRTEDHPRVTHTATMETLCRLAAAFECGELLSTQRRSRRPLERVAAGVAG